MTDYLPKVTRIRVQIQKLADDIRDIRNGMPPKEESLAAVDAHIQREAAKVTIRPSAFIGGGGEVVSAYPERLKKFSRRMQSELQKHLNNSLPKN